MQVDLLVFGAHPDDIELCAAGTILSHQDMGYTSGIVDLTAGELGTRGSAPLRLQEAQAAAEILGVRFRNNLGFADGFFDSSRANIEKLVAEIRRAKPKIILANAPSDRHPDHGRAAKLVADAVFYSGLRKIEILENGVLLEPWRPQTLFHYIQDYHHEPDFVVDITGYMDRKEQAILAFRSQFFNPSSEEPATPISSSDFLEFLKGRARDYGRTAGFQFAEGYVRSQRFGIKDLGQLY
ncbi:MAG: bacillithiol biosynthesis deacetylase BshB1 [Bacteroidota bacterium]